MKIKNAEPIQVFSNAFTNAGPIPKQYTGFGSDISPDLNIPLLHADAVSIAVFMNDIDIPLFKTYNHWTIWNIPAMLHIPENIPPGPVVESLGNARQGVGYGQNRYRGPKPPAFIRNEHRYEFHVLVLDCMLDLDTNAGKKELLKAAKGHILQHGHITGIWSNTYLK